MKETGQGTHDTERIAVVGMAGRFPGAGNVRELWRNLRDGVESISFFSDEELLASGVDAELLQHPRFVKARGTLEGYDCFDASFFGFSRSEAAVLDPQDRLFLECAWAALEDAGCDPETYPGSIGVFGGETLNTYLLFNLAQNPQVVQDFGWLQMRILNDRDFLTTQASYRLNLRGPSITVQTACSTSLVAVHLASESLLAYQSDVALAGGVSVLVPHRMGYLYQEGGIASPDGHCRAFDAQAGGTIGGSGVGIVVLKRLEDALADGDTIRAVIRSSAVNNDGAQKVGFTAPSVKAQSECIATALGLADIDAETVTYIEAHGTATRMGDPVEIEALTEAFRHYTAKKGFCSLGSIKTNIGHLDPAAGVAGLIKTVLALERKQIPPSLHFKSPNPEIDFENSPFYVNAKLSEWKANGAPRRAGVSSLGVGGTNAHVILEEAPQAGPAAPSRPWQLVALSAKSAAALDQATRNLSAYLEEEPGMDFPDAAYTLLAGRRHFEQRRVAVCRDAKDAASALSGPDPQRALSAAASKERGVAFLLPGQGAQYPGMARQLYQDEPVFRESLDLCCDFLRQESGLDLLAALYSGDPSQSDRRIRQTALAQPLLFSIEYSLAQLWMEWGIRPQAMIGHSVGELTAACLAEVMDLDSALALVALRGRLMQSLPAGAMLSVPLPESQVQPLLAKNLWLAAVNAPSLCVVSGTPEAVSELEERLGGQGVECRRLHVSHAFHSGMMDPVLDAFAEQAQKITLSEAQIPFISNLSGGWIEPHEATDPAYWVQHIRQPVRFAQGAAVLLQESDCSFLEVGPGSTLTTLLRHQPGGSQALAVPSLPKPQEKRDELELALHSLGRLWLSGVKIDPQSLYRREKRRRIPLPTYPFERIRHWIEPQPAAQPTASAQPQGGWLTTRLWKQAPPLASKGKAEPQRWLVVLDRLGLGEHLVAHLQEAGHHVVAVEAGEGLARFDAKPEQVLYLAGLQTREVADGQSSVDNLCRLAEELSQLPAADGNPVWVTIVTSGAYSITGNEELSPPSTALAASGLALEQEFPGIRLRIAELDLPDSPSEARFWQQRAKRLLRDLWGRRAGSEWAYRKGQVWHRTPQAISASFEADAFQPRQDGFYALADGGSGAASGLAQELVAQGARLLLLHSDPLDDLNGSQRMRPARLDLSDRQQVGQALKQAEQEWGDLHGFVHLILDVPKATQAAVREVTALSRAFERHEMDFGLFVLAWPRTEGREDAWLTGWVEGQAVRLSSQAGFPCSTLRIAGASAAEIAAALRPVAASQTSSDFGVSLTDLRRRLAQCEAEQVAGSPVRLFTQIPFEAPRNSVEQTLADIWEEVLGVSPVGIHDSFLELGGHSLLATQVSAKVSRRLRIELPTSQLSEAPTLAALAEAVADRPQVDSESAAAFPAVRHDPSRQQEPFPLTDVQQAYWIGRSGAFDLGQVATHSYLEIDSQDLDVRRLERAWQRLVDRHGMLRAVVQPDGRQQILDEVPPYRIEVTELSRDEAEQEAQLEALRRQMSHQVLPGDRWPLFELRVARWPDGRRTRLYLSIDMLIADVRSFFILRRDLGLLYDDPEAMLPELEISFSDYVMAEQQLRQGPLYSKALQYWRSRLDSLPAGPDLPVLPTGLSAPRFQRRRGRLEAEQWTRLKSRAARIGVSQPGLLLTVFSKILATWSKKPHFTLNLTLNNRLPGHPQVDEIVGDFTSLIPLEVDFTSPATFQELARRLQKQLWRDLDHRYVSGVRVVRELAAHRRAGVAAALLPVVFTSALNMGSGSRRSDTVFGLPGQEAYSISQTPQVWLDHQVGESSQGVLAWNWDAVEELFPEGMLDAMMEAYQQLLEELAENEEAWQQELFGLIPSQDLELQEGSNATEAAEPEGLLQQPLLEQARMRPDHPAVISSQRTLSCRQLVELSSALAHCLRGFEVSPDTLVAVVMEHGWEQVPAVVGILQSGAAYLPIDANLPHERLCYLLQEGQAQIALTQSWLDSRLDWPQGVRRIAVDTFDPSQWPCEPPPPCQEPDDLAYVIFTSGSTGHPKGVMIEHAAALNTIADINRRFEVGAQDRILAVSALNFDLSVYDIFGLLGAGGTLVMPDRDSLREPARWLDDVQSHRITFWNSVPALVEMLAEQAEAGRGTALESLRLCLMSGDWIPPSLPERLRELNPEIQVVSGGGATEAAIWSILYPIDGVDPKWKSIPYGRPMANQRFYVLDRQLQPRPCWVPGELYIAGLGLARGYWRDGQKTDAAFIDHPVSGQRLYRTGDLGRFLPDGNIEFLGREDTQVKVQGMRIELGEIEAALRSHPEVQSAAVEAVGEMRGHKRLVGYVVGRGQESGVRNQEEGNGKVRSSRFAVRGPQQPDSDLEPAAFPDPPDLRRFLASKLPQYMIPATFVALEALPLSPNGKVDRAALPSPQQAAANKEEASAEPRNPVEEAVMNCWVERLPEQEFGIFDDFFQLGGDSLLATRVLLDLQESFPVEIPLRTVFERPTVAELAEGIEELLLEAVESMPEEELQSSL